ncbi:hypothetical protein LINGRAHAP2_LOCUS29543, partial [Linum grandiflorum]
DQSEQEGNIKMNFNTIEELSTRPAIWTLRVRVSREWVATNLKNTVLHQNFILIDEKGNDIWAKVPLNLMANFENLLQEQKVYTIHDFRVKNAPRDYQPIANRYAIELTAFTIVTEIEDIPAILKYNFTFIKDGEIPRKLEKRVLLSGNISYIIYQYFSGVEENVFSTTGATKIYVNPAIPQIAEFQSDNVQGVAAPISTDPSDITHNPTVTLDELNVAITNQDNKHKYYLVESTIQAIKNGWCYTGCETCPKKIEPGLPDYYCCKSQRTETNQRFRIQLEVYDETGGAEMVLLDRLSETMLGTTAQSLHQQNGNDISTVPQIITTLLGKNFKAQVQEDGPGSPKTSQEGNTSTTIIESLEDDIADDDDTPIATWKSKTKKQKARKRKLQVIDEE